MEFYSGLVVGAVGMLFFLGAIAIVDIAMSKCIKASVEPEVRNINLSRIRPPLEPAFRKPSLAKKV